MKIKLKTMYKIVYILSLLLLSTTAVEAQRAKHQKIKLMKVTYITNTLELTPEEAAGFWPVYNQYNDTIHHLKRRIDRKIWLLFKDKEVDTVSEETAQKFLVNKLQIEKTILENKTAMLAELSGIISAKKMLKLGMCERDFNRRLLHEFRKKGRPEH
jgi:hypothetical protein